MKSEVNDLLIFGNILCMPSAIEIWNSVIHILIE